MNVFTLGAIIILAAKAWSPLPEGEWRVSRPILLPPLETPSMVYLPLDEDALSVKTIYEFRIARDDRTETPYQMIREQGQVVEFDIPARVVDSVTRRDNKGQPEAIEIILDLDLDAPAANCIKVPLSAAQFRCDVRISESADAAGPWRQLGSGELFIEAAQLVRDKVGFRPNTQRYLRVSVTRKEGALPSFNGLLVQNEQLVARTLVEVEAELIQQEELYKKRTRLDLVLKQTTRDIAELRFDILNPVFERSVLIAVEVERTRESGEIYKDFADLLTSNLRRVRLDAPVSLAISAPPTSLLRLYVDNKDDRPLTVRKVTVFRERRGLLFLADPKVNYELWYDRPDTSMPRYDIAALPLLAPPAALPQASLGPVKTMAVKPPEIPWGERHRVVLWAALLGVLVLLIIIIVRAMRGIKAIPPPA